jgi:hypothetical protein
VVEKTTAASGSPLTVRMRAAGGFIVRLAPTGPATDD